MVMHKINFEKAKLIHKSVMFSWLKKPYIQEFWDNTQEHKDDIINFMNGRSQPSNYCNGEYIYWIASINSIPFGMIMSIQETGEENIGDLKLYHLSKTGHTYSLDYLIGNNEYLGKGYGSRTLVEFIKFFTSNVDKKAHTFFIDPDANNLRAIQAYEKAGFSYVGDFIMGEGYSGSSKKHYLFTKKVSNKL